jgi:hypothetical protein
MAQAVSHRPLTVEARVRARVSPCGICGGLNDAESFFSSLLGFPLSISFHRVSKLIYHLGVGLPAVRIFFLDCLDFIFRVRNKMNTHPYGEKL